MKMMVAIVDDSKKEQLEVLLADHGVVGYTEISPAVGMGLTGPRLGSRAFPKRSAVILSILEDDALGSLASRLREICESCGEQLKIVAWDVDSVA